MDSQREAFLNCFSFSIQERIIEFCKELNTCEADIFIVMARKAACFIWAMQEIGLLHLEAPVLSDRVLDMDCRNFAGKNIAIIDDIIISGSTVYNTIQNLRQYLPESISVHILATSEEWFTADLFYNKDLHESCIVSDYIELDESESINFCSNTIQAFFTYPRPYDMDFPFYRGQIISEDALRKLLSSPINTAFLIDDEYISGCNSEHFTLIPSQQILTDFAKSIGLPFSKQVFSKIRLYARKIEKKNLYYVTFLSIYAFEAIHESYLSLLFETLTTDEHAIRAACISSQSKLRVLQYSLSDQFFGFWFSQITKYQKMSIDTPNRDWRTQEMMFSWEVSNALNNMLKNHANLSNADKKGSPVSYSENIPFQASITEQDLFNNPLLVNSVLNRPFISKYSKEEIEARKIVRAKGRFAFESKKYKHKIDRLNYGFSFYYLRSMLPKSNTIDINTTVSLFLDSSLDNGIIVPICQHTEDGFFTRRFRHGEDILFSKKEEERCREMLTSFSETLKETNRSIRIIPKIWAEKLIVLFIKSELNQLKMKPFTKDQIPLINKGTHYMVRMHAYIHGIVAAAPLDIGLPAFLGGEIKERWLTSLFEGEFLRKTSSGYRLINPKKRLPKISKEEQSRAERFGFAFGKLYEAEIEMPGVRKEKNLFDDDCITRLASLSSPKDTATSLAAELAVFCNEWPALLFKTDASKNKGFLQLSREINKSDYYTALNSCRSKLLAFLKDIPQKIANNIENCSKKEIRVVLKGSLGFVEKTTKQDRVSQLAIKIGQLTLCLLFLILLLELHLRLLSEESITQKPKQGLLSSRSLGTLRKVTQSVLDDLKYVNNQSKTKSVQDILIYANQYYDEGTCTHVSTDTLAELIEKINVRVELGKRYLEETEIVLESYGKLDYVECKNVLSFIVDNEDYEQQIVSVLDFICDQTKERKRGGRLSYIPIKTLTLPNEISGKRVFYGFSGDRELFYEMVLRLFTQPVFGYSKVIALTNLGKELSVLYSSSDKTYGSVKSYSLQKILYSFSEEILHYVLSADEFLEISFDSVSLATSKASKEFESNMHKLVTKSKLEKSHLNWDSGAGFLSYTKYAIERNVPYDEVETSIIVSNYREFDAVRRILHRAIPNKNPSLLTTLEWHTIGSVTTTSGEKWVSVSISGENNSNASACFQQALNTFKNMKRVIMVGIAGGIPDVENPSNHVRLGDICLPSEPVINYNYVKNESNWEEAKNRSQAKNISSLCIKVSEDLIYEINCNQELLRTPLVELLEFGRISKPDTDRLFSPLEPNNVIEHPYDDERTDLPKIHLTRFGSTDELLKSPWKRDQLKAKYGISAVEMECYGVATAATKAEKTYFMVRGIIDYCDGHKNDDWYLYSCTAAAAFLKLILERI